MDKLTSNQLEFWLKVKEEAEQSKKLGKEYICLMSKTFSNLYDLDREPFKELAREFLVSSNIDDYIVDDEDRHGLMAPKGHDDNTIRSNWDRHYSLRPMFIEYCINKFSQK